MQPRAYPEQHVAQKRRLLKSGISKFQPWIRHLPAALPRVTYHFISLSFTFFNSQPLMTLYGGTPTMAKWEHVCLDIGRPQNNCHHLCCLYYYFCYYIVLADGLEFSPWGHLLRSPRQSRDLLKQTLDRNWTSHVLRVDMYPGEATLEVSLALSQKDKHSYHRTQQFQSWLCTRRKWKNTTI